MDRSSSKYWHLYATDTPIDKNPLVFEIAHLTTSNWRDYLNRKTFIEKLGFFSYPIIDRLLRKWWHLLATDMSINKSRFTFRIVLLTLQNWWDDLNKVINITNGDFFNPDQRYHQSNDYVLLFVIYQWHKLFSVQNRRVEIEQLVGWFKEANIIYLLGDK